MSWKDTVKAIAPTLGTALGGPLSGAAVKFIADKLLGDSTASIEEVEQFVIGSSAADMLKLKELDHEFKLEMKALEIDVFELEVKDKESARGLFKVNIWPQITLSAIFVVGYFGVLYFLLHQQESTSMLNNPVFTTILGVLTAAVPQILGFWFGSSLGSKEKTNNMKNK